MHIPKIVQRISITTEVLSHIVVALFLLFSIAYVVYPIFKAEQKSRLYDSLGRIQKQPTPL